MAASVRALFRYRQRMKTAPKPSPMVCYPPRGRKGRSGTRRTACSPTRNTFMSEAPTWLINSFIYLAAAVVAVPLAKKLGLGSIIG